MNPKLSRRHFLAATSAASASALLNANAWAQSENRPNILWLTSEDNGPQLGCYGDAYADTPHIDRLAAKGVIYTNAWSTAPVCAPARTTIISGVYPPCTGSEHMRSMTSLPAFMKMSPCYLREAGYYCTNNSKEDYNLEKTGTVWDESSAKAHWRNRQPGQPFFAIFNFITTHESQIRKRPHTPVHDPAKVRIPAYHPDTPEVRQDWAQYYDKITEMDAQVGNVLKELEEDGLAGNTIVFYYGDHGAGMPRSKRWLYNSGLHVPLVVHIPEKYKNLMPHDYQSGGKSDRLVGFIDLAPTLLSLAGILPPDSMQGHAFLGKYAAPGPEYAFGFRGRMDERYDLLRTVRDKRYQYIRNYMPHLIYGQHLNYMFETPTTQVWKRLYDEGKLKPPQTFFWETKPSEELYDLENDPDAVNNLADSPDHRKILDKLQKELREWELRIRDVGFLPEGEIHSRSQGSTPYEMGHDPTQYPLEAILTAAERASSQKEEDLPQLKNWLVHSDSCIRYWAAMGILMQKENGLKLAGDSLRDSLEDESPYVRIVAANALGKFGDRTDLDQSLSVLMKLAHIENGNGYIATMALNAIGDLGDKAASLKDSIKTLPVNDPSLPERANGYVARLIKTLVEQ